MATIDEGRPLRSEGELDVVIAPGISVHMFGNTVGIYCDRMEAGRGFAEMPVSDFEALLRYFGALGAVAKLRTPELGD